MITVILSWIAFKRYIHKEINSFNKHIGIIATCKYNIGAFNRSNNYNLNSLNIFEIVDRTKDTMNSLTNQYILDTISILLRKKEKYIR